MFEILNSLPARQAVAVVHQAIRILRHLRALPVVDREATVRTLQRVLREPDAGPALALVREIELGEGKELSQVPHPAVDRYVSTLADVAERKMREQFRIDPARGRELLLRMRTAAARTSVGA